MANVYRAELSDGSTCDVTTDRHHADHDDRSLRQHLPDAIKSSSFGIVSGVVVGYVHKGRK